MSEEIAMQNRCVHCKKQQYAPTVYGVSLGTDPCAWCGKHSKPMAESEYLKSFFYCQTYIEDRDGVCNKQCEHCKIYYKPLEQHQL